MAKRRQKVSRRKGASSADIRFAFLLVALGVVILALGGVLVGQARSGDWTGAMISGGIVLVLLAIGIYSAVQKRRA